MISVTVDFPIYSLLDRIHSQPFLLVLVLVLMMVGFPFWMLMILALVMENRRKERERRVWKVSLWWWGSCLNWIQSKYFQHHDNYYSGTICVGKLRRRQQCRSWAEEHHYEGEDSWWDWTLEDYEVKAIGV